MHDHGEGQKEMLRPDFNRSISLDFLGAKLSADTGFLLLREIDERFGILGPAGESLEDARSPSQTKHSLVQMMRQRIIKAAARVSYHSRRWWVHVASDFPLAHHYRAVLGYG